MMKKFLAAATLIAFAAAPLAFAHTGNGPGGDKSIPTPNPNCWPDQNPHDYVLPGGVYLDIVGIDDNVAVAHNDGLKSLATAHPLHHAGVYVAGDYNSDDCDGDGEPGDFDGDLEFGFGGGFFPAGPWAAVCGYNPHHANDVHVHDAIFQPNDGTGLHEAVRFTVGADPSPPTIVTIPPVSVKVGDTEIILIEGGDECVDDGCVCPGDLDPDDWDKHCIHKCDLSPPPGNTNPSFGQPGGDGGFSVWVDCSVETDGQVTIDPPTITVIPPTTMSATCSLTGHIYFPNTWPGKA